MQDDCENFVCFSTYNETFSCGECVHILALGQMIMIPFTSSFECKLYHSPPFCVTDCGGRIYYVVHRLQSMSRATIHLGVHNHPVVDGKCRESIEETKRLIAKEVCRNPTLAKCGGEAQHLEKVRIWSPSGLPNV